MALRDDSIMRSAYTLVEFLIVGVLIALIGVSFFLVSVSTSHRKSVDQAVEKLESAVYRARDYALAGRKISCTESLTGWKVVIENTHYQLIEGCTNGDIVYEQNYFTHNTSVSYIGDTIVSFQPLGLGLEMPVIMTLSGNGYQKMININ